MTNNHNSTSCCSSIYVKRALACNNTVRAYATDSTALVYKACEIHSTSPVASAAFGRVLTVASIMSGFLKDDYGSITIQIKGNGPLECVVVVADSKGNIRGYTGNPGVDIPLNLKGKLDVSGALGKEGYINVITDLGLKEPYIGRVNLASGEIGEDFACYFAKSEQIPSIVALGVLIGTDGKVLKAGGYIVQLMPGADENVIDLIETNAGKLKTVTELLSSNMTATGILSLLLEGGEPLFQEGYECRYKCNCSRERMISNLISLGQKELLVLIEEQQGADLHCHFCNSEYHFTSAELVELLQKAKEQLDE